MCGGYNKNKYKIYIRISGAIFFVFQACIDLGESLEPIGRRVLKVQPNSLVYSLHTVNDTYHKRKIANPHKDSKAPAVGTTSLQWPVELSRLICC